MADTTGQTPSPIISDLMHNGHEFSFPQVMRLARTVLGSGGEYELPEIPWQERVRVRPDLSFAFPAADVARIEQDGSDLQVTATFLGLYGSSSPLPAFYTEDLMDEASNDSSVSRDFLDILHQRLYQLYFACWSKYRIFIRMEEEKNLLDRERLFCLIGLGEKELRDSVPDAWSLVRYAGLLTQFPRSAEGLQTLLRDSLGVSRLEVEQCVLRKVPIPVDQRMSLGISGMRLGVDTVLGSEIADRMGKFRILVGPLKKKEFDSFLPGTPQHNKLLGLIRLYVLDPFDFDLKVTLAAGEARPITLGDAAGPRLGWNTWCFAGDTLEAVNTIFSPAHSKAKAPAPAEDECDDTPESTEPPTLLDYYKKELALLRDLADDYIKIHPDMAPLVSGHMADSGVERLLEGTAFLNAHLRMKIEDDFPEVIHGLTDALHPWDLRPIPATTIVAFTHKPELKQSLLLPAGAEVASIPVQGTTCRFQTCFDVTVHPLALLGASFIHPSGKAPSIVLQCELNGIALSGWKISSLRFFLGDEYSAACDLYLLLMRYLKRIVITSPDNNTSVEIAADCLKPVGFAASESILTKEKGYMPGHLILQEYFLFPDKFLFMDLTGLDKCKKLGNGSRFEINFELAACPLVVPQITDKSIAFSVTPVINLFEHKARPISFIPGLGNQAIRPEGEPADHFQIYSVDRVEGLAKNRSAKISYDMQNTTRQPKGSSRTCQISQRKSTLRDGFDTFISIPHHTDESDTLRIKLGIDLTCTNGTLPEQLGIGDVSFSTRSTPEFVEPRNIKTISSAVFQDSQQNRQWRLISGFSLNRVSLDSIDSFRAILKLFINSNSRHQVAVMANNRRIDGIVSIDAKQADRLIGRSMYRGYEVLLRLQGDHFVSPGDLYQFCSVLEQFLGGYVTQSCFMQLIVEEICKGYRFEWPTRFGDRCVV